MADYLATRNDDYVAAGPPSNLTRKHWQPRTLVRVWGGKPGTWMMGGSTPTFSRSEKYCKQLQSWNHGWCCASHVRSHSLPQPTPPSPARYRQGQVRWQWLDISVNNHFYFIFQSDVPVQWSESTTLCFPRRPWATQPPAQQTNAIIPTRYPRFGTPACPCACECCVPLPLPICFFRVGQRREQQQPPCTPSPKLEAPAEVVGYRFSHWLGLNPNPAFPYCC